MSTSVAAAGGPRKLESRIGKRPVVLPKGVKVEVADGVVRVEGPKGKLSMRIPPSTRVEREGDALRVTASATAEGASRWQGLSRALLANMVHGAAQGYERVLELVGTGYRCEVKGKDLHLALGLSHPVVYRLPESVSAVVAAESKGTIVTLTSPDKAALGQVCATVRGFRPPEPYAGKGVRYRGEQVRRKAGKAGKAGKK